MSRLKNKVPNVPKVVLEDYFWLIAGVPKSGKTSLFALLAEKYFKDVNKCLLLAFEKGYGALKIIAEDINSWEDFIEIVDELIESKEELPYELIGLDTVDKMYDMARDEVIKKWNRKNPDAQTDDIAGVGAKRDGGQGFGIGYQKIKEIIDKQLNRLIRAGYGIMAISHSKDKEVEQKSGLKYDQLVASLPQSVREVFVNMAYFMVFITIEKEKSGNNLETKRYMYFRSDGYVDAGSRFRNVPEKIEYDVDEFIRVFEEAVKTEVEENADIEKMKEEQKKYKLENAKQFIEKEKISKDPKVLQSEISKLVKTFSKEKRTEVVELLKEFLGDPDYRKVDDVELLQECIIEINKIEK